MWGWSRINEGICLSTNAIKPRCQIFTRWAISLGFHRWRRAAYTQGRLASLAILGDTRTFRNDAEIPTGIYTSPEISSVGKTERQLTEEKIPYEVGNAQFKNLARAQIAGRQVGMLKLLFHRETLEIWAFIASATTHRKSCI